MWVGDAMTTRLGNTLLCASILMAAGWIWLNVAVGQPNMGFIYMTAGFVVVTGIAARYLAS